MECITSSHLEFIYFEYKPQWWMICIPRTYRNGNIHAVTIDNNNEKKGWMCCWESRIFPSFWTFQDAFVAVLFFCSLFILNCVHANKIQWHWQRATKAICFKEAELIASHAIDGRNKKRNWIFKDGSHVIDATRAHTRSVHWASHSI